MVNIAPAEFIRQVRKEASKVTWASRKDTTVSTVMVLIMVSIAALFFVVVDSVIFHVVQAILGL